MKKRIIALVLAAVTVIVGVTCVFAADAGSEADPLVTKSYVDSVKNELRSYIDSSSGGGRSSFELVTVSSGQSLVLSDSTELIMRMGTARVIGSSQGGLCDTTGGYDLANNAEVPSNHMLISPRNDGRGVTVTGNGDAIFMVRGSYTIR